MKNKKGKEIDKGWDCDLIPKPLVINRYFAKEQQAIDTLKATLEQLETEKNELTEEHSGEEGALQDMGNKKEASDALLEAIDQAWSELSPDTHQNYTRLTARLTDALLDLEDLKNHRFMDGIKTATGKILAKNITQQLKVSTDTQEINHLRDYQDTEKQIKAHRKEISVLRADALLLIDQAIGAGNDNDSLEDIIILRQYLTLLDDISATKKQIKEDEETLDNQLYKHYPTLTEEPIKQLVVDDKWLPVIDRDIHSEMDRISQRLTGRIKELAERYELPLPKQNERVNALEKAVGEHLGKMGFAGL